MADTTSLQNLHDIVIPAAPAWLPPAPGWYALSLTLLLLLTWGAWHRYRIWQRNRYRRQALVELDRLEQAWIQATATQRLLLPLPVLIKRAALAAYGRERVASLSGIPWLAFLDRTAGRPLFDNAAGQLLLRCDYAPQVECATVGQDAVRDLFMATRAWLTGHRLPGGE